MSDDQQYGWDRARTFHGVWLNQLEQGHCTWMDKVEKLKFYRALVWHPASSSPSAPPTTRALWRASQCATSPPVEYNALTRPGTKDCQAYNTLGCEKGGEYPEHQHICFFCLLSINRLLPHPEKDCIRKEHSV